jgi:hypothetical protein
MIDHSQLTTLQLRVVDYITTNKAAAQWENPDTVYIDIPRHVVIQSPGEELEYEDHVIDLQLLAVNLQVDNNEIHTTLLHAVELPADINFQYIRIIIKSLIFSKL